VRVTVKLFGAVREAVGAKDLSLVLQEGSRVADVRDQLAADHPVFEAFGDRLAISVNLEIAGPTTALSDGDEVAILPPVSGGSGRCALLERPLDVGATVARVTGPGMGGIVTFVGAVRDHARGHSIRHLEYDSYPAMAEREMEKIVAQAERRWPGARIAISHRCGHLEVGDIAVVVAVAAPHRDEAFAACRFAIDTLKQTVPIWKKEVTTDGEYWVDDRP
jgi:molybdopterin synthase catalytic subunit